MRGVLKWLSMALVIVSCGKESAPYERSVNYEYGRNLSHEKIVLGERLENPYKTENMRRALSSLYPTKAEHAVIQTTDLYVRFLPADQSEYELLDSLGLEMVDHPLDYSIAVEGDWYHDPDISEDSMTWQYAVVPKDFVFPDVRYEVIDECFMSENSPATRSVEGIDWELVERQAYTLTGNAGMLCDNTTTKSDKATPSGRITIVDKDANGGKPFGVAGVCVSCNSFIKFDKTYTDRDGYYTMNKQYSSNPRYRLIFENSKGFSIGFNLILLPASISTLGEASPLGVTMTVTEESEDKLFRRCVVNNAAYDYYTRCGKEDMDITPPPSDLRLWIFRGLEASSAVMLHHGTVLENEFLKKYLGDFAPLIYYFLPDITIGTADKRTYQSIYSAVCHELAHASHFMKTGTAYWDKYIFYIIKAFVLSGGLAYGDGTGEYAGYCDVGESWAYYMEGKMFKERYGGSTPNFGTSFWFYPQILRYLDERGIVCSDIFSVLNGAVTDRQSLKTALLAVFPNKKAIINQAFSRYGYE
ncbi:MAG: hypothetical protein J6A22_08070 [Bacteroidales bacterium]|nr:hypothetical protein [Bacteroidales bacterium]